jgi:TRAP-type C4-dicarboxylate transport system permease large subunit
VEINDGEVWAADSGLVRRILAPLFPEHSMVVYAISCSTSIGALFLAGVITASFWDFFDGCRVHWSVKENIWRKGNGQNFS